MCSKEELVEELEEHFKQVREVTYSNPFVMLHNKRDMRLYQTFFVETYDYEVVYRKQIKSFKEIIEEIKDLC
jgi:hypothetical protein